MPRVDNDAFYRSSLIAHGETAEGVHWNSVETQEVRFRALRSFLPEDISGLTLVDAGCGFGDLYCYLRRQGERPKAYLGLDVMAPMVETARARTGCEIRVCDILGEELPRADYYLCSGAMNTLTRDETRVFIRKCFEASGRGFLFNLLKGWNTSTIYNLFLPREIRRLGRDMEAETEILEGYLSGDFSVALRKPQ
ncbi:class I SAM-dependent methyltransferase [Imhoffiella purpurea]|uniref:Methyltransferase domain-containing protein n=1 Tax=Imhoffiella purpurea TaxID=1249627 RepID=W9V5Q4_9GAMM|nr:class I SAM-dependent methyltransferase [Imhoffiella purpurea]EXJ14699.1 hypothetical protein D779_2228 [Imhoffiella purpurea]